MKKVFILLFIILITVGCSNETEELKETIAEQDQIIVDQQEEIESLEQEALAIDDEQIEELNAILMDYQIEYDNFSPDIALNMYNFITEYPDIDKDEAREELVSELDDGVKHMYQDYFDEIVQMKESFN